MNADSLSACQDAAGHYSTFNIESPEPCAGSQNLRVSLSNVRRDFHDKIPATSSETEVQIWPITDSEPVTTSSAMKTDSGVTHTVPNGEVITVTKHTLITTGKPPAPTSHPPSLTQTSSVSGQPTTELSEPPDLPPEETASAGGAAGRGGAALSTGAIVGAAVGGIALVAVIALLFIVLKRRRKIARQSTSGPGAYNGPVRDDFFDDKHFPRSMSPHTTGTQDAGDPFAPFGGRVDEPQLPTKPRDGAFEMDAASTAPVELPASNLQSLDNKDQRAHGPASTSPVSPVTQSPSKDPQANLNALRSENGQPAYVNHWNQYRAMGSG